MLKYILFALVFCISTPSFCVSKSFINNSLSNNYIKNRVEKNNHFTINKNTLIAKKIIKKKRFPFFGIGSIVSFLIAVLFFIIAFHPPEWLKDLPLYLMVGFYILGICLSIVGLSVSEFWVWSVLGLLFNGLSLGFWWLNRRQ